MSLQTAKQSLGTMRHALTPPVSWRRMAPFPLTAREREIAALVATGASNKEIAYQLEISIKTVKNTLTNVFNKTGARSRTELAIRVVHSQYAAGGAGD